MAHPKRDIPASEQSEATPGLHLGHFLLLIADFESTGAAHGFIAQALRLARAGYKGEAALAGGDAVSLWLTVALQATSGLAVSVQLTETDLLIWPGAANPSPGRGAEAPVASIDTEPYPRLRGFLYCLTEAQRYPELIGAMDPRRLAVAPTRLPTLSLSDTSHILA